MKHWRLVAIAPALLTGCDLVVGIEPWTAGGSGGAAATSGITASVTTSTSTMSSGSTTSASSTGSGCETCGGGACVDLANDAHHCGACNVACFGNGPSCESGICAAATLTTLSGATRLATTPTHIAVAQDAAISFVPKDGGISGAAIPIPDGSITALASFEDQIFAATASLYSVPNGGQPKLIGNYVDPDTASAAPLDATSMTLGSWQGNPSILIGTKVVGRPIIAAPLLPGTLVETTCTTVNSVLRVSAAGTAVARLATNDDARVCGSADAIVTTKANDLALVAAPASVVLATTGALVLIDGSSVTPLLEDMAYDFRLVTARGQQVFVVVSDGATHRVMTTKIDGNSAGTITTIYTSNAPISDMTVDARGVYLLDKGSNIIAIGY